jgi:hypothetical protein
MNLTINSDQSLSKAIGEIREVFRAHKFLRVIVRTGKDRSLDQNAISHAWYEQIADELREDTALGVKNYCKLHLGVPILRAENEDFRLQYDAVLKPLSYEKKLMAMNMLPVTSLMTKAQLSQYLEAMQMHYAGRVKLEFPEEA